MTGKSLWLKVLLAGFTAGLGAVGLSGDHQIDVMEVWARATAPSAKVGATYFVVRNKGHEVDTLIRVESPLATKAEMHTSVMHGDLMKMEKLDSVEVTTHSPLVFEPGGHHVMLMGLDKPLVEGDSFPLTLVFDKAGPVEVTVAVRGIGAMENSEQVGMSHQDDNQNGDHSDM